MPADVLDFDAIAWINTHFQGSENLDFEHLRPILCFSLIWNIFETKACHRRANRDTIRSSVDRADETGRLRADRYQHFLNYFRDRYLREGTIETTFDRLLLTDRNSQEAVRRALLGISQDLNNLVFALLLIAHRIRNNLFHGNKEVTDLPIQTELFVVVNSLLATYLEDLENLPSVERLLFR